MPNAQVIYSQSLSLKMDLFQNISSQTTILTPNRRLAAVILEKHKEWQLNNNFQCWPTLDILPLYPSWLERTLKTLLIMDLTSQPLILTTQHEHILWEKILTESTNIDHLLQISETAKLAKSAWETLKRWNVTLDDPALRTTDDSRAFLRWAEKFHTLTKQKNWIDQHSIADVIADKLRSHPNLSPKHLVLIGFTEIAPQYQQLLNLLKENGCVVDYSSMPNRNQTSSCIKLTDNETEIRIMAQWAKHHLKSDNLIGCIIPNLETVREQVIRIFSIIFEPNEFNISAGKNLIDYPMIYDALQFLQLTTKTLPLATWSGILKSPFLGEAEKERHKRALFDLRLHQLNVSNLSLTSLLDKKNKLNFAEYCPSLAQRLQKIFDRALPTHHKWPIHSWVTYFNELLTELGWPGERSLNSYEYQVVQHSWLPLLNQYAAFSHILKPTSLKEALHYLTLLATHTVFQPESPKAPVQVLGLLEAADIPFNYSWVMGLEDTLWPPRPKPNPFIPLRLQKSLNMPNASAERELNYCDLLTHQLQNSSEHIVFSYPAQKENMELRPSALLKDFPRLVLDELTLTPFVSPAEKIFTSGFSNGQIEKLYDETAPMITTDEVLGGVKIFKTQAECPFKAFSELRLHAKKIDAPSTGLRKLDRGNIMHKALEFLWKELQTSERLLQLSHEELNLLVRHCAERAIDELVDFTTATHKRYLALECKRVEKLILQWLEIEKARPPFTVTAIEKEIITQIGKITAHFRVDRIDELIDVENHNKLIIDYKTGKNIDKKDWFGARLGEPQLPIYCIAYPDEIVGIAFAKLNPSKMALIGTSRIPLKMNSIATLAQIPQADATLWDEQINLWKKTLEQLAEDFYQGKAEVNPKDPNINCRLCGLFSLCRIHELNLERVDECDE